MKIFSMTSSKERVDKNLLNALETGIKNNHRTIIGVNGKVRDVVHHIHALLTRHVMRPRVLWVYEKSLDAKQSKIGKAKKRKSGGDTSLTSFESFIVNTEIVYSFHDEAEKVLGTTTDLCVLQDFSSIRANTLASVIESVKGGGIILLSVEQTESIYTRRLYRLLAASSGYIVIDSQMHVISSQDGNLLKKETANENLKASSAAIDDMAQNIKSSANPLNPLSVRSAESASILLQLCKTADQAQALTRLWTVLEARSVVAVTADRGRGKSAALGLAVALALIKGLNDILIVSPNVSNVQTLFEFVVAGLNANGYKEQIDYNIEYSRTNKKAIEKVVVSKTHYQTVKFSAPHKLLYSPSLLVVDEAAAVPLPVLKEMIGMYPTLLSSTTAGYEGTGRALSLKFFKVIKPEIVHLEEPIRYCRNDPVEAWLNGALSLSPEIPKMITFPKQEQCKIFSLNRSLLFSGAPETENVLKALASILLSGHYKNSPNDLQILADNPHHTLIALLTAEGRVLGLAQCVQEGRKQEGCASSTAESRQHRYNEKRTEEGDLIPWSVSQYYMDLGFFDLAGIRVVRIAIHPDAQSMGYGSYLVNQIIHSMDGPAPASLSASLFRPLSFTGIDYIGVSFGVTQPLLGFWMRFGMLPVYLKHTICKTTGEHSLIMIKSLSQPLDSKIAEYRAEFTERFMELLPGCFQSLPSILATQLLLPDGQEKGVIEKHPAEPASLTERQIQRLKQFALCNIDLRLVLDILPALSKRALLSRDSKLSATQKVLLLALGLQHKPTKALQTELDLSPSQLQMLLAKAVTLTIERCKGEAKENIAT